VDATFSFVGFKILSLIISTPVLFFQPQV